VDNEIESQPIRKVLRPNVTAVGFDKSFTSGQSSIADADGIWNLAIAFTKRRESAYSSPTA